MHNEHHASINPVISADGLTKRFGETVALDNVALSVDRGEIRVPRFSLGPFAARSVAPNRAVSGGATRAIAAVTGLRELPAFRAS